MNQQTRIDPTRPGPAVRLPLRWLAGLSAILLVGLLVRWVDLGQESLWFDEGISAWTIEHSPAEIVKLAAGDNAAPGFYLTLHAWTRWFGNSETALRSLSALFSTLTLGLFVYLASRVMQHRWAWLAAVALFAVNELQVEHARDARTYAMLAFFSLGAIACAVAFRTRHTDAGRGRAGLSFVGFVLCLTATLYLHNIALFYLPATLALWLLLPGSGRGAKQFDLGWLALAAVVVGLLYLPWVPTLIDQIGRTRGNFWAKTPSLTTLVCATSHIAGAFPIHARAGTWGIKHYVEDPTLFAVGIVGVMGLGLLMLLTIRQPTPLLRLRLAVVGYGIVGILAVFLYSLGDRPVFVNRVMIASGAPLALLAMMPLAFARQVFERRDALIARCTTRSFESALVAASLLIVVLAGGAMRIRLDVGKAEDWRGAFDYVATLPDDRRAVLYLASEGQLLFDYYAEQSGRDVPAVLESGLPRGFFETPQPQYMTALRSPGDLAVLRQLQAGGGCEEVVLVLTRLETRNRDGLLERYIADHFTAIESRSFGTTQVARYELSPASVASLPVNHQNRQ